MSEYGDQSDRCTRLYTFPGGVLEVDESPGDEPGVGVYVDYHPRQLDRVGDVRASGPGEAERLRLVDDDTESA
jgi:hypothetical protein